MRGLGNVWTYGRAKSLGEWYELIEDLFYDLWIEVDGTDFLSAYGGDPLILSVSQVTDYVPDVYAGTITCPDIAALYTADTDNLWGSLGSPTGLSVSDLIDTDYDRTLVLYDNDDPHHIRAIGILGDGVVLTQGQKDQLSNLMQLWAFFFGGWNDNGAIKENRTFE